MKRIAWLFLLLPFLHGCMNDPRSEKVNWVDPAMFSASEVSFRSGFINMDCHNCKCIEISTGPGVTGLFVMGTSTFDLPSKSIADSSTCCMIRCNPTELGKYVQITGRAAISDSSFHRQGMLILRKMFRHCYHSGIRAIIPPKDAYALNMYSGKYGDVLASFTSTKNILYSFTYNKEY